jgi:uncharacterized protein
MGMNQFMRSVLFLIISYLLSACAAQVDTAAIPEGATVQDLYIVDCLLPGQVRQLGNTTYMTPRRPVSTTAVDCRIRGGEYVAYDRADYKTALKVWMPAAEAGDAEAQNTVGEIFERGLGTEPNYVVAALWFERAAKQGHKGAQFNLGTLYEAGNGVKKDKIEALNWYRRAWGLSEDSLQYRSDDERALIAEAEQNIKTAQVSIKEQEEKLRQREKTVAEREEDARLIATRARIDAAAAAAAAAEAKAAAEAAQNSQPQQTAAYDSSRSGSNTVNTTSGTASDRTKAGMNYGKFYALVIGNADYRYLENLVTPLSDVQRLGDVLKNQYGFSVQTITNGDDASVLHAVNELNSKLQENDNLLIYYAGHGNRRQTGQYETGYWLPVNAEPPPNDTYWVPTEQVSGHLARLKAKRILVVADSSFSGLLADNPAFLLVSSRDRLLSDAYIQLRFPNKSRLLLASGQDIPLMSNVVRDTSVFTGAFLAALQSNHGVLTAPALFLNMLDYLDEGDQAIEPEFKAIKRAGDEVGDFFFVAI